MKKSKILLLTVLATSIVACSSSTDADKVDYTTPGVKIDEYALEIPPDLVSDLGDGSKYSVPEIAGTVKASELAKQPHRASSSYKQVLPEIDGVKIITEGSTRWLVVNDLNPQDIWPLLKDFWTETGFVIDKEQPKIGFMETQWAENRAKIPNDPIRRLFESVGLGGVYSSGLRDKFTIQVERTTHGSRVAFTHQGMEEVFIGKAKDTTKWVPRNREPLLEAKLINMFMLRLGLDETAVKNIESNPATDVDDSANKKKNPELKISNNDQAVVKSERVLIADTPKIKARALAVPVTASLAHNTTAPVLASRSKAKVTGDAHQQNIPQENNATTNNIATAQPSKKLQTQNNSKPVIADDDMPIRIKHEKNSLSEETTQAQSDNILSSSTQNRSLVDVQNKPRKQQTLVLTNTIPSKNMVNSNRTTLDSDNNIILVGNLKSNKSKIKAALKNLGLKISNSKDNGQTLLVYQNIVNIHETMKQKPSFLPGIFSKKNTDRKILIIKLSEGVANTVISVTDDKNNTQSRDSQNITTLLFRELR